MESSAVSVQALVIALLTSSAVVAVINWIRDRRKIQAETQSSEVSAAAINVESALALMGKMREELDRYERRVRELEDQLSKLESELEALRSRR